MDKFESKHFGHDAEETKAIYTEPKEADKALLLNGEKLPSDIDGNMAIKDVWLHNFFTEMEKVSSLVDIYNYISMVSDMIRLSCCIGH